MKILGKAVYTWVLLAIAAMLLWLGVGDGPQPTAGSAKTDDVEARTYRDGWGVVVSVPTLGDTPAVNTFAINPTPGQDVGRVGPYTYSIDWGAGPGGAPVVTLGKYTAAAPTKG